MWEGGPSPVCSFCSIVSRHTVNADCDVFLPAHFFSSLVMSEEQRCDRQGKCLFPIMHSEKYLHLPFLWQHRHNSGLLGSSHTNADASVCGKRHVTMSQYIMECIVTVTDLYKYLLNFKFSSQLNMELWMVDSEMMVYLNLFHFFKTIGVILQAGSQAILPHAQRSSFHRNEQAPSLRLNLYFSYYIHATGT